MLSVAGGAIGLLIDAMGHARIRCGGHATRKPVWIDFSMDYRAFAYLAAISLGASHRFSADARAAPCPARPELALKDGGRGAGAGIRGKYLSGALVVAEMSLR